MAARIAPRMDITRTIDNIGVMASTRAQKMEQQEAMESPYLPAVASYQDTYIAPLTAETTEFVYVQSQLSPPANQQPASVGVFGQAGSGSASAMGMAGDFEPLSVTGQYTLEGQYWF